MKKKMNNKGFTLVELIVVLVILAILAAILVPALLGYIDRAKKQQIVLNAKTYLTATQAEFSALYGANKDKDADLAAKQEQIQNTADVPACDGFEVKTAADFDLTKHETYTIYAAKYEEGDQFIYFANGTWDATKSEYESATYKDGATEKACGKTHVIKTFKKSDSTTN